MTNLSLQNHVDTLAIRQCVTLIPCNTLEDFPAYLEDAQARSLLAAWTAPWHPILLAAMGRLPAWQRADSLPDALENQWLFLSSAAQEKLPSDFWSECETAAGCRVLTGNSRAEFLTACGQLENHGENRDFSQTLLEPSTLDDGERLASPADFYALGYAWLQVQLMTRRLRYTSNLDEIYFASRVVEAARNFVAGHAAGTIAALHEAFDALAEERDHYFSTDPHLIDLTLLAPSTLGDTLRAALLANEQADAPPLNVLVDVDLAPELAQSSQSGAQLLRKAIDEEKVGVAGGGIRSHQPIHHQTAANAARAVAEAKSQLDAALGPRCQVFARASGPTPGDLGKVIASQGYLGAIPIDFTAGEGWSSEAKLIWISGQPAFDVLVAKPIDGSRSDSFLTLGVRLGQAIDGGEIATALIVHWPGTESDAYLDLRRASSWSLALGRFWKIDDFFRDGQRPYHHYRGKADEGSSQWLLTTAASANASVLSDAARAYRQQITAEAASAISSMADLVLPRVSARNAASSAPDVCASRCEPRGIASLDETPLSSLPQDAHCDAAAREFCNRMSVTLPSDPAAGKSCIVVNPHACPARIAIRMDSYPEEHPAIYGSSVGVDGRYDVTVDIPAHGFVTLHAGSRAPKRRWFASRKRIASDTMLVNEFMQADLAPLTGGLKGIYSGSGRGNRFSLRLIHVNQDAPAEDQETEMIGKAMRIIRSDESVGVIEVDGILADSISHVVADFTLRYSLCRGSRWLWVEADIKPTGKPIVGQNPWKNYFAFRSAFASEATSIYAPLRDKLHRVNQKRLDSPAGLLVDESDKQTLLFADGRPAFRQVGERYVDSLLLTAADRPRTLRFAVGFDVPHPVVALRALAAPPAVITCDAPKTTASTGWLIHCATADVIITDLQTSTASPLVITFLLICTRNESRKAKVRFCRDVIGAWQQTDTFATGGVLPLPVTTAAGEEDQAWQALTFQGDLIEVPLAGHEIAKVYVTLKTD